MIGAKIAGKAGSAASWSSILKTLVRSNQPKGRSFGFEDQTIWDLPGGHSILGNAAAEREIGVEYDIVVAIDAYRELVLGSNVSISANMSALDNVRESFRTLTHNSIIMLYSKQSGSQFGLVKMR